jgi:hypothetical protein
MRYDLHSITVDGSKSISDITNLVSVENDLVIRSAKFGKQFIYFEVKSLEFTNATLETGIILQEGYKTGKQNEVEVKVEVMIIMYDVILLL